MMEKMSILMLEDHKELRRFFKKGEVYEVNFVLGCKLVDKLYVAEQV